MALPLKIIILAAGKGTRMKSSVPKVLHQVCGKPIVRYVLDLSQGVKSSQTYVVLGHKMEAVREVFPKEFISVVQPQPLGTADAVKCTQRHLAHYHGNILILCADTPLLKINTVKNLIKTHLRSKAALTFLTAEVPFPSGYGRILRGVDKTVLCIREEKDATLKEKIVTEINVGVYCFKSVMLFDALKEIKVNKTKKEFYLTDIVQLLLQKGLKVETFETEDYTEGIGINTRQDLALAGSILRKRILQSFMEQGITIIDPQTTYIDADVKIGRDTVIHPFTLIESDVRIGKRCSIGPFCRIRPGTTIGHHVEVGNFTEISRSRMGNGCFMKHFSFLGDAQLGRQVNVGAGVVTANFDGKRKNVTEIADHAFLGSDSILIAPLKIGRRVITGAGSVVTAGQVIPDRKVVVGVPARIKR